jgi:hypothetical protein
MFIIDTSPKFPAIAGPNGSVVMCVIVIRYVVMRAVQHLVVLELQCGMYPGI